MNTEDRGQIGATREERAPIYRLSLGVVVGRHPHGVCSASLLNVCREALSGRLMYGPFALPLCPALLATFAGDRPDMGTVSRARPGGGGGVRHLAHAFPHRGGHRSLVRVRNKQQSFGPDS